VVERSIDDDVLGTCVCCESIMNAAAAAASGGIMRSTGYARS
jgi:hypothetical protein